MGFCGFGWMKKQFTVTLTAAIFFQHLGEQFGPKLLHFFELCYKQQENICNGVVFLQKALVVIMRTILNQSVIENNSQHITIIDFSV